MAASCSSNPCNSNATPCGKYHVFLSFRGEDTRLNFADRLYEALQRKGITTFRDDEQLEGGEVIKYELLQAIEESLCAIVILSEDYASSSWCLNELQKILECRRVSGMAVLPVFYGIDPSVVRYQTGSFAEAFRKHGERFGEDNMKVKNWRNALSEVASISGYHAKNQSEGKLIENIIRGLWTRVESHLQLYSKDGLVGIDSMLKQMYQILEIGSSEVCFVGIWGMGGMGKTTIARLVFNQFHSCFDISCCLENVRERSSATDGLLSCQLKLLSKLKIGNLEIDNVDQGKAKIRNLLSHMKVLLLLDDVDDIGQLEHLAGKQDWFGQGSRVIVTTRNRHLLDSHEAPFKKYKIGALNIDESLELFSRKAFKENRPKEGYFELSNIFLEYCQGLPLALKVLGSLLYGGDIFVWEDTLKKIRKNPPKDIMDTLRISFEGLEDVEKNIFLDIACFFKGWDKNRVMQILEICDFYPESGTKILYDRSLLTCDNEIFEMHDLLQEMGRNIVRQKSGCEKGKQSRLWSPEDIEDVLGKKTGTEFIQGVVLETHDYMARFDPKAFSKMCNLRVLIFHGLHLQLPFHLKCLSNSIKVLEWSEYPLPSLPPDVKLEKLVVLKLHQSKIKQLWNGIQDFKNLKLIDLSFSKDLIHTPNFFGAPNLESLILEGCSNLVKIHPSIGQLRKLVVLNLKDCINLKYLPRQLETNCLKDFNLSGCSEAQKLLEFVKNGKENKSLEILDLSKTPIQEVPSFVGRFQNLKQLSVHGCGQRISKPWWMCSGSSMPMGLKLPPLSGLRMLRELDASDCNLSSESVADINCLPSLEILRLSGNTFSGNSILMRCKFSQFSGLLRELDASFCNLSSESVVDINCLPSLEILRLSRNNFSGNFHLSQFSGLSKLKELDLSYCSLDDESIPDDLSYLPSLEQLILCGNNFINLPRGCISNLTYLWNLDLDDCLKLQALPAFPPSLRCVHARNCGSIIPLPETQVSEFLMQPRLVPCAHVINIIPAWFEKQKDVSSFWKFSSFQTSFWKFSSFQDSIIVDIPDCCWSSEWWGIVFCFMVKCLNDADLNEERFLGEPQWCLKFGSNLPEATASTAVYDYPLEVEDIRGFIRNHKFTVVLDHQFTVVLDCDHVYLHIAKDGGNRLQLFFGVERCFMKEDHTYHREKLNICECGWRVICRNEMQ